MAMGLSIYWMSQKTGGPLPRDDTSAYWQQALMQENEYDQNVDDMILSEVLQCWSEVEWNVEDILGTDSDGQEDSINNLMSASISI